MHPRPPGTSAAPSTLEADGTLVRLYRPPAEPVGRRRAALVALVVAGTGLVGSGALSAWQATTDVATGSLTAAEGSVELLDANGSTFTSAVPDLLPGDYFYRYVDLRNSGSSAASYTGEITAGGALGGSLSAAVEVCPTAWATTGGATTCPGSTLLVPERGLSSPVAVDYGSISPGTAGTQHVRFRFSLSSTAASTLMGESGSISASVRSTLIGGRDRTAS